MTPERWQKIKPILASALERPCAERPALLSDVCAEDSSLRAEIESLIAAHEGAGTFIDTPALSNPAAAAVAGLPAASRAGLRIGPYEVIRELGHGGMGVVYLAARADHAFHQQVAIKIVRGLISDAYLAQRFRHERQILANLNHPCVARLLDGGATDEGAPYLVMEYVEGVPIHRFCDLRGLDTRQRLELFRLVCDAVHYAHRNLVIHRDLKPDNILVTADGTPKLLDFGIAKLLETDAHDASLTLRSFTPEYASPEQIRGEPMTTATDVYSLAMLLYLLLTGRRPYGVVNDDPLELARTICEVEPSEPGTVAKDLDTILLKALRKEPDRRYGSVEQFSNDISRYLEGLPVLAAPDRLTYRAAKFVRRHTIGVVSVATLLLTLAGATIVTTWQARIARRERAVAEQRFNDVRQLANVVVGELHDAIKDLSGATAARKLLVTRAVEYLDRLAGEAAGDVSLQRELADAYAKMGDAQGNPYLANLGDGAGAMRSYQKAFELHAALAAGSSDVTSRRNLAADHVRIADMLWADGQYAGSLERYRVAMGIDERLASEDTTRLEDRFNVTRVLNRMGQLQMNAGELAAALQLYRQSLALASGLTVAAPQNVTYRRGFGVAALKIGDVADRMHDYQTAFNAYSQSERILRQLSLENPASADLRRTFALALERLAIGHLSLHRSAEAVAANRETLGIYETLATTDPDNVQTQIDMADTYSSLGEALSAEGDNSAAAEAIRRGMSIYERNRGYTAGGANVAKLYLNLGAVLAKTDAVGALDAYRQAAALFAVEPARREDPSMLAESYAGMGDAQAKLAAAAPHTLRAAQWQAARHWYEESLAIWITLRDTKKAAPDQIDRPAQLEERIAHSVTAAGGTR